MKTTLSYFSGMFENPAPAEIVLKKSKILWNINYIQMRRKIIDDYCFLIFEWFVLTQQIEVILVAIKSAYFSL